MCTTLASRGGNTGKPTQDLMSLTLRCHSFSCLWRAGRENSNTDALSCNPVDVSLICALSAASDQPLFPDMAALKEEQKKIQSWLLCFTTYY